MKDKECEEHRRLRRQGDEFICDDCNSRMAIPDGKNRNIAWIAHMRDLIAAAPKPASITPRRLRPKGAK